MTFSDSDILRRSELLLGTDTLRRLGEVRVLIFGVGGVGSWCAESLIRTGVRHLTLVDADCVAVTNCNRQLMATTSTVGHPKVEALRERLLDIASAADIVARQEIFSADTADSFHLEDYDYIIDAIDSLRDKVELILRATALPASTTFFSSMGAALRRDPLQVRQAEFWQVKGDALARALRERFKREKHFPRRKFRCVYSEEQAMRNAAQADSLPPEEATSFRKAQINGSLCPVTATFGLALSSLVINHVIDQNS